MDLLTVHVAGVADAVLVDGPALAARSPGVLRRYRTARVARPAGRNRIYVVRLDVADWRVIREVLDEVLDEADRQQQALPSGPQRRAIYDQCRALLICAKRVDGEITEHARRALAATVRGVR